MSVAKKYNEFDPGSADLTQIILTADPDTGALGKIPLSALPSSGSTPQIFQFLLSQSGTSAPSMTVLQNNFTFTPSIVYTTTGIYTMQCTGLFANTGLILIYENVNRNTQFIFVEPFSDDLASITTRQYTGSLGNGILDNSKFTCLLF